MRILMSDRRIKLSLFCLVWLAGLILGGFIANQASAPYLLLMRRAAMTPVSITGLLATSFLPILFCALSVYISKPRLIYWICFFKACSFTIVGFTLTTAFGSAGWLVSFLMQLTDAGILAALCWFSCRHIDGTKGRLLQDCGLCIAAAIVLGCIDYCYVSPFLASLIENSQMGR